MPNVSIGLPVYNGARFLGAALDSILAQSYRDFEVVISDNASTDGTQAICEAYLARDTRVRYVRSDVNRGAAWNFSQTFELAKAPLFKWAAHDDVCDPMMLERCVSVLAADPTAVLAFPRAALIDEDGTVFGDRPYDPRASLAIPEARFTALMHLSRSAPPVFSVIRSEALKRTRLLGNYDASDLVLMAELSLYGRFVEIPETLLFIREHPGRSVRANPSAYQMTAWFAPERRGRLMFPEWRILVELFAAVTRAAPLSLRARAVCYREIARRARWHRGRILSDLRFGAQHLRHRLGLTTHRLDT